MKRTKINSGDLNVVPESADTTDGVLTWWDLSGTVDSTKLLGALERRDFDANDLPDFPTSTRALHRAMSEVRLSGINTVLRQAPDKSITLLMEDFEKDRVGVMRPIYVPYVTAWVDDEGEEFELHFDHERTENAQITSAFARNASQYATTEVSAWLLGMLARFRAVSTRTAGGVYFVPRHYVERYRAVTEALMECSTSVVYYVPVARSVDAVRAIMAAVTAEALREAETLMDSVGDEKMSSRALHNRAKKCRDYVGSLSIYEELFGQKLVEVRDTFDRVSAAVTAAALAADV